MSPVLYVVTQYNVTYNSTTVCQTRDEIKQYYLNLSNGSLLKHPAHRICTG